MVITKRKEGDPLPPNQHKNLETNN